MMHSTVRIIFCFAVMVLAGCASQQASVKRANDRVICQKGCEQQYKICSQVCHNNCKDCNQSSALGTACNYKKYTHEQQIQGGVIARELNSFSDPLQCRKISCDCSADYTVCAESCKGLIHKRLQTAPLCC